MGKSLELLGLTAFNIMIAIIMTVTLIPEKTKITQLNHSNVKSFVTELSAIAGGQKDDMDAYSIITFFMKHIAHDSQFISNIDYNMPASRRQPQHLEMNRNAYISHILQAQQGFDKHETAIRIENIEISDNGTQALVVMTNFERGVIPVDDGFGDVIMLPVTGSSFCEQKLSLTHEKIIQVTGAVCDTRITFAEGY